MNRYRNLLRRVAYLEALLYEGKQDQENLLKFLGQEYYDKYNLIKNKIKDPDYKDIYKLMKLDLDDVKDYIDELSKKQSNTDLRRDAKKGAKLIYNKDGWKVYRITTYKAAQLYGSNTTWCITGRYEGHEERGEQYFNDYISEYNLDGGYYFYIKNNNEKYCLLRSIDGEVESVWDAEDNRYEFVEITDEVPDFPSIPGVAEYTPIPNEVKLLFSRDVEDVRDAIEAGVDINGYYQLPGFDEKQTALYNAMYDDNGRYLPIVELLLDNGADVNYGDASDRTPLMQCCYSGNEDTLAMLLRAGANVNAKDNWGRSAVAYAVFRSLTSGTDFIKKLARARADLDSVDNYGMRPLTETWNKNEGRFKRYAFYTECAKTLLKMGANVDYLYEYAENDEAVDEALKSIGYSK